MKKNKFRYKSIFLYASLQFCGNIEEYFSKNSQKLVVFNIMPRLKNDGNILRIYNEGQLVEEKVINLSSNIFLYYFLWLYNHWRILLTRFKSNEKFFIITGHPVSFFGLSLQRLLRNNAKHVYWMGDYFPGDGFIIKNFERLKRHYHDAVKYRLYLSDGINKVLNKGTVIEKNNSKTIMWGVKPLEIKKPPPKGKFNILFVGLIKDSQGLDKTFDLLRKDKSLTLNIIGICNKSLHGVYKKMIKKYKIEDRIYFPNKFFSDEELFRIAKKCHVGIALYDTSKSNPTYYTDPGKVKTYTQLQLPVIMTNTSGIAPYIRRYKAGVVTYYNGLPDAILEVKKNYSQYMKGLEDFNNYFNVEKYYRRKFKFLS